MLVPILSLFVALSTADIFLHTPRGSNNRLNENSANRENSNRLFDSQNNNRGSYNVGDATSKSAGKDESQQYRMKYFQSDFQEKTLLTFEWTNQHGCGGNEDSDPHKQNCNIVFQYMCQEDTDLATGSSDEDTFRNGVSTKTQNYKAPRKLSESKTDSGGRRSASVDITRGQHESWHWYDKCTVRERNKGLFTADQQLKASPLKYSSAIYTRQNAAGTQHGYECPEERDYYPYWHPTPWRDIAVLAENTTMCRHYQKGSFNVRPYHECVEVWDTAQTDRRHYSRWNNKQDCENNGGYWTALHSYLEKKNGVGSQTACEASSSGQLLYQWAVPHDSPDGKTNECLLTLHQPACTEAPWTRSNHLGNGRFGEANNFTWEIPHFPSKITQRCVLRVRYNVSTDDYDPYHTDSRHNQDLENGVRSPVETDPYVEIGAGRSPLQLAINTAQLGRVFQDRTHVFLLRPRPQPLQKHRIYNLNVRGKRGNIVQVYPSVEYDFFPNPLHLKEGELVHIQWTGSSSHNNGNPAGDGQSGSDGEGQAGTDRNNLVQIGDLNENFPMPFENTTMWSTAKVMWIYHGQTDMKAHDLAINLASSGYYTCKPASGCGEEKGRMQSQLDNANASYEGVVLRLMKGTYHFICTRNNNYTNRSQKGSIHVH